MIKSSLLTTEFKSEQKEFSEDSYKCSVHLCVLYVKTHCPGHLCHTHERTVTVEKEGILKRGL